MDMITLSHQNTKYDDSFCFIINVYKEDSEKIKNIVNCIKSKYTVYDIILICDGVDTFDNIECEQLKFEREKYPYNDGRWTHRYLKTFLEKSNKNYLIKLDPDCDVVKKFNIINDVEGVFGYINLMGIGKWKFVLQGGRYGIDRKSVEKIVNSELLLSDFSKYKNIQDLMMTDVLHQLNIPYKIDTVFMDSFLHKKRGSEECKIHSLKPSKYSKNIKDVTEIS